MAASSERVSFRTQILTRHLQSPTSSPSPPPFTSSPCLSYSPPDTAVAFDTRQMRSLLDGHNIKERDWLFNLIIQSNLFNPRNLGHRKFVCPDYNQSMEQQREMTMRRVQYLLERGAFEGFLTGEGTEAELKKLACFEIFAMYDHSLAIKLGVHFFLW